MKEVEKEILFDKIWDAWGQFAQLDMAIEEMSELTKEICKLKRTKEPNKFEDVLSNIADEIADVEIMLHQMKYKLAMAGTVEIRKAYKLRRLEERFKKHLEN